MFLIKRNINVKKTSQFDIDLSLNDLPLNEQKLFSNIEKEVMSFFKINIEPIILINSKNF